MQVIRLYFSKQNMIRIALTLVMLASMMLDCSPDDSSGSIQTLARRSAV